MNGTGIAAQTQGQNTDLAKIFELVRTILATSDDPVFRRRRRDFSRGGPLSPEIILTMLLYMVADGNRRGYSHLLDGFWDEARSYGLALPTEHPVTAASFCTARPKVTCNLLGQAVREVANSFDENFGGRLRWRGRRVFAVDGTKINLQRSPELHFAFGTPSECYCPQILLSVLLDVCGKIPVDLQIAPFASSERDHLLAMLLRLHPGDVLILDRGYPSHGIMQAAVSAGIDFMIRLPSSHTFSAVALIQECSGDDYRVVVAPPPGSPKEWRTLELRVVRLRNPDGEASFFFTTLPRATFSTAQLRELYHMRWEAEEFYKLLKSPYIGQGQFRSKSALGVRQEMHALVLFLAITRFIMVSAAGPTKDDYSNMSQKAAVLATAAYVTRIFLVGDRDTAMAELRHLLTRIVRTRDRRRPQRSCPRVSYKPSPRWGPQGRRGG